MQATAKDLRLKTKEILEAIERGEEIVITYRGKEKAKLIPLSLDAIKGKEEEQMLFGIWKDNEKVADTNAFINELRGGRFDDH